MPPCRIERFHRRYIMTSVCTRFHDNRIGALSEESWPICDGNGSRTKRTTYATY